MVKTIFISIMILCSTFVYAQQGTGIVQGKNYNYFTSVNPPDFTKIHTVDSLIKIIHEKGIIEVIVGGDYDFTTNYEIFYSKENALIHHTSRHSYTSTQHRIFSAENIINHPDSSSFGQHVIYQYTGQQRSSAYYNYFFAFVLNGKIVNSLISNVPLNDISDENLKEKIKLYVSIF
ncbi:MAG TPA: hypothetical protein VFE54_05230 [Mucilaginibacter sp.]|nr:hypothetical protein [Mucilaginibacter sp.]